MRTSSRSPFFRYGIAVLSVAVAAGVRWLLTPLLGESIPFATFFLAVIVAAWHGGTGPALVAAALGTLFAARFFVPAQGIHFTADGAGWIALCTFVCVGLAVAFLSESMRTA